MNDENFPQSAERFGKSAERSDATVPEREPYVHGAVSRLELNAARVSTLVAELLDRLAPVMAPDRAVEAMLVVPEDERAPVPVADRIDLVSEQLQRVIESLSAGYARLEV